MNLSDKPKMIISVAGGKGGVGKSIFSVALGTKLAMDGNSVALVDLDLGAANLHTYLGIIKKTPTIADFILKKVPSLEEILLETSQKNLKVVSGAEFVPGMANPAHWMKLKIMRHIKALPADFIIIDLGAGVHFNTLDFFSMSDRGIVITAPEPGAVMNAYSFIKSALFRKLQSIFKKDPHIGPIIESETKKTGEKDGLTLEKMTDHITTLSPDMLPLIQEIEKDFCPALVVNRTSEGPQHVLVKNLIALCRDKLGLPVEHAGNLPDIPEITNYLLKIPDFLKTLCGSPYLESVRKIADKILKPSASELSRAGTKSDFTDDDVDAIIRFMETLDESIFSGTSRNTWKLKMYFKPSDVVDFLISRGATHQSFFIK
jgi:flagellar biosynthesis protein FlhG